MFLLRLLLLPLPDARAMSRRFSCSSALRFDALNTIQNTSGTFLCVQVLFHSFDYSVMLESCCFVASLRASHAVNLATSVG